MLSNRTANFKENKAETLIIDNEEKIIKQYTTPLHKFDIHFDYFSKEEEKVTSSFSFKNELLDKKAYNFIKSKDECLTMMELDDSIPNENDENNLEIENKKNKEHLIKTENSNIN